MRSQNSLESVAGQMSFPSTSTEFAMIDARTTSGAFVLPLTTEIPGRIINIKDAYGAFTNSSLTVYTQGGEAFEDGTNFKILNNAWDQLQVYTASTSRWYITGGTEQVITTTNISIVSTIQTFNWPSLCNAANFGYGSTFNPAAIGRIALLDNIFTSSTASLASTFIEMGNLNAAPAIMSTGGAFRWLMGVEPDVASMGRGLQFKIKRWNSFGFSNSRIFYGANLSTLVDTVNINSLGYVGINCNNPLYHLDINGQARIFASTIIGAPNNGTARLILGPSPGNVNYDYCSLIQSCNAFTNNFGSELSFWTHSNASASEPLRAMTIDSSQRVGINNASPSFTLDATGTSRVLSSFIQHTTLNGGGQNLTGLDLLGPDLGFFMAIGAATANSGGYPFYGPHIRAVQPNGNYQDNYRLDITTGNAANSNIQIPRISVLSGVGNGNVGIGFSTPLYKLDVDGLGRTRIILSTVTTNMTFAANSFGTYYNMSNTGITAATLPALLAADNGWFIVLRNNTSVSINVAWGANNAGLPASSNTIPASNSVTVTWNGSAFILF